MRVLGLLALAACQDQSGTIELGLTTAPGSTVLDAVERLRVTITEPRDVFETVRTETGFHLDLDVEATGLPGKLIVEGFAGDALVATGMSPPFAVSGIDAKIVVYMAAPMSIEPAPAALSPAREFSAAGSLTYGAILVGGRDPTTGTARADVTVYNAYLHAVTAGLPLPAPRLGPALAIGSDDAVYLFGGLDANGNTTGTLWRFDTSIPPNGAYSLLADEPAQARTNERMVPLGLDRFLITGTPILEVDREMLTTRTELPSLPQGGAGVVGPDGVPAAVFAGTTGITRFRDNAFGLVSADSRGDARAVTLPDRTILVAGGSTDAVRVDVVTGALTAVPGFLPITCPDPELAATTRHVVVSCGTEVFIHDAASLQLLATLPSAGTSLAALPTDQVLMLRGSELALFTPPPP
ncbi:MAG: hypothetical protein H0T42_10155 [Deltaproteobacteria bacterium]|nr:hypothetical protein [Deltaproteobacteria bacterium]